MKTDRLIERYIDYRGLEPRQLSLESDSYSCNWVKKKKVQENLVLSWVCGLERGKTK